MENLCTCVSTNRIAGELTQFTFIYFSFASVNLRFQYLNVEFVSEFYVFLSSVKYFVHTYKRKAFFVFVFYLFHFSFALLFRLLVDIIDL